MIVAVFAVALFVSSSFSPEARLVPRLISVFGLAIGLLLLAQELRQRRARRTPGVGWPTNVGYAVRTFAWMAAFLALVVIGGYLSAVLVFVPAFLLYVARASARTVVIYSLVLAAVLVALPTVLPVDLPTGLLAAAGR